MQDHDNNDSSELISDSEIDAIAKLSMLEMNSSEKEEIKANLQQTLQLFSQLKDADVNTVVVSYEQCQTAQGPRDDIVVHDNKKQLEKTASTSPHFNKKTCYFDVPPVIEVE